MNSIDLSAEINKDNSGRWEEQMFPLSLFILCTRG